MPAGSVDAPLARLDPCDVPALRSGEIDNPTTAVFLWLHTGTARVSVAGRTYRLSAGQALWIHPGVPRSVHTEPGALLFPLVFSPDFHTDPSETVTQVEVPPGWDDWLIWQFALNRHYLRRTPHPKTDDSVPDLVTSPCSQTSGPPLGTPTAMSLPLPLPHSSAAREVAYAVLDSPSTPWTLDQHSVRVAVSARTLQRHFLHETGMGFRRWRQRARILAAMESLRQGRSIGQAGREIGLQTPAAFTSAFRRETGMPPRAFVRELAASGFHGPGSGRVTASPIEALLPATTSQHRAAEARPAPPVPASRTWERVNPVHVGVWLYRGAGTAHVGDVRYPLTRGEAIWIPAGLRHSMELEPGSVLLRLVQRRAHGLERQESIPRVVRFGGDCEHLLLHVAISSGTRLQSDGYDEQRIVDAFHTASAPAPLSDAAGLVQKLTATLQHDPSDRRTLDEWARDLGVDRLELREAFTAATGDSIPRWRARLRMSHARALLLEGEKPSVVARRLGYAHLSGFSKVFTSTFGLSPRQFQQSLRR